MTTAAMAADNAAATSARGFPERAWHHCLPPLHDGTLHANPCLRGQVYVSAMLDFACRLINCSDHLFHLITPIDCCVSGHVFPSAACPSQHNIEMNAVRVLHQCGLHRSHERMTMLATSERVFRPTSAMNVLTGQIIYISLWALLWKKPVAPFQCCIYNGLLPIAICFFQ